MVAGFPGVGAEAADKGAGEGGDQTFADFVADEAAGYGACEDRVLVVQDWLVAGRRGRKERCGIWWKVESGRHGSCNGGDRGHDG